MCSVPSVTVSQAAFPQTPAAQTVSVGSSFKVHCHTGWLSSGAVYWYKQRHREHLQFLHMVRKHIPAEGRFSGEINDKSTIYTLVIEEVQRNDSGVYYCAARKTHGMFLVFGNGSKLFTTGPPTIFLLAPPVDEAVGMETVPLMCLVNNAGSVTLPVRWNFSTWETEGWTDSGTIDSEGAHNIRSLIRVPPGTCSGGGFCTCSVQITSTQSLISEMFSYQTEPRKSTCLLLFYGSSLGIILLLLTLTVVAGWSCIKRHSGNGNSDKTFTDSGPRERNHETLYARLAFTADPTS
ncbi:immunoglobulin kappa light chain-like [Cetorhinus maximus]